LKLSDFEYELPPELIAQIPAERRDAARLLVHELSGSETHLTDISHVGQWLRPADLLVINDTKVLPARLHGKRSTGGAVEFLFTEPATDGDWWSMVKPAKKLKPGECVPVAGGALQVQMIERPLDADGTPGALWRVRLQSPDGEVDVEDLLEAHGQLPLPPYISRGPGDGRGCEDLERYQTVYANHRGAVAAPTAGLHLTRELLAAFEAKGVEVAKVTLHVGLGTFLPVAVDNVDEHRMHSERYVLPQATVDAVARCRAAGGRVVAVGTTSVRVLESCAGPTGELASGRGRTEIFLRPGAEFRVVDGLLTNFHLPGSTLLMLVSAFVGTDVIRELYARAIEERMRFFSYGDAMLLLR
jgi:S-adenosylmethionine:tRNA ribosyltransferase-isomerase